MGITKIKQKEVKVVRKELLEEQEGICPLCNSPIESDPVLDHCHVSGHVRAVLHRDCNALLGKVENYIKGYGKNHFSDTTNLGHFFLNAFKYMQNDYSHRPLHYKHKTEYDKQLKSLRVRMKRAKKTCTKKKIAAEIKALKANYNV